MRSNEKQALAVLLLAVVLGGFATMGNAQETTVRQVTLQDVALNLARMKANESSLNPRRNPDGEAIWHTTWIVAGGPTATLRQLYRAQRRLSSRVTGVRDERIVGNVTWSRDLQWNQEEPPRWSEVTGLPWDGVWSRFWERTREWAMNRVTQHVHGNVTRPCRGEPYAWGGTRGAAKRDMRSMALRNADRISRGLDPFVQLSCGHTINIFLGLPPDVPGDG